MNELIRALNILKQNCIENEDCEKCCFYNIDEGCYIFEKIPAEYDDLELEVN